VEGLQVKPMEDYYEHDPAAPYEPCTPPSSDEGVPSDEEVVLRKPTGIDLRAAQERIPSTSSSSDEEEEEPPRPLKRQQQRWQPSYPTRIRAAPQDPLAPDLSAYFSLFNTPNEERVKICRSYANFLAASDPSCRMRRFMPQKK